MNPLALSAALQQLYYYPPSAFYPYPYNYGYLPGWQSGDANASGVSSPAAASDASGAANDGNYVSDQPAALPGYWTLPPSAVSAVQRNKYKPSSRILSALTRSLGMGRTTDRLLGLSSSSSGLGQLGGIGGFSSSGNGGKGSMMIKKKKLGQLSKLFSFENALGVLTLLAFSLFLIVFFLNALAGVGRKRRRTSNDGALADGALLDANVGLLEFLSNPEATASWYREGLPEFLRDFRVSLKKLLESFQQSLRLTYLDIVGTARARDANEVSKEGDAQDWEIT